MLDFGFCFPLRHREERSYPREAETLLYIRVCALINVSPAHSPPGGAVTFCLDTKSNQKNQVIKKASALPAAKTSGAAEVPANIPAIAGPLFITAPRSLWSLSPLLWGGFGRGVSDSGLLLDESGKTMLACGGKG
jgi:hypothetical protein